MRPMLLAVAAAVLVGCAARTQPLPDVFPAIPEVRSHNGVARVFLRVVGDYDTHGPQFQYGLSVGVAPTIRVSPGDLIEMTVENDLPPSRVPPDTVNVHFHG
ncbi:MAG: hypothetical protein JO263_00475, partial [Candidatus Eremiobacteraeota bacterium]|nr:hypothetical protein [Candidatus Eremiobacteraeota bacterium]